MFFDCGHVDQSCVTRVVLGNLALWQSCQMCHTFGRGTLCCYCLLLEEVSCIPEYILCEVYGPQKYTKISRCPHHDQGIHFLVTTSQLSQICCHITGREKPLLPRILNSTCVDLIKIEVTFLANIEACKSQRYKKRII